MSCPVLGCVAEAMLAGFICLALVVEGHAWARISVTVSGEALAGLGREISWVGLKAISTLFVHSLVEL